MICALKVTAFSIIFSCSLVLLFWHKKQLAVLYLQIKHEASKYKHKYQKTNPETLPS